MPNPLVVQLILAVATPVGKAIGRGVEKLIDRRRVRRVTEPDAPETEPEDPEVVVTLRIGSKGETVRELQSRLDALGYPLTVDGDFGPGTLTAVRQFQAAQGLHVDGIVGPATWAALSSNDNPQTDPELPIEEVFPEGIPGRALSFALSDVGKVESPLGSNSGQAISHLVDGYNEYWRIAENRRFPWCAMAVSVWTARALGLGDRGDAIDWKRHPFRHWFGAVAQVEDWGTAKGRFSTDLDACLPGAIYTMAREGSSSDAAGSTRAGHTGLVVSVDRARRVLHTVDGNVSNKVATRTRSFDEVEGWIQWWD